MSDKHFETAAIRTQLERSQFQEHTTPMYVTSSFVFDDAEDMRASFSEEKERNIYSRFSNPNTTEFVEKVVQMEEKNVIFILVLAIQIPLNLLKKWCKWKVLKTVTLLQLVWRLFIQPSRLY